jgi:hypothetical protein
MVLTGLCYYAVGLFADSFVALLNDRPLLQHFFNCLDISWQLFARGVPYSGVVSEA